MSVDRFDMEDLCHGEYSCGMLKAEDGEFVAFEDYEVAEAKLEKISAILAKWPKIKCEEDIYTAVVEYRRLHKGLVAILEEK